MIEDMDSDLKAVRKDLSTTAKELGNAKVLADCQYQRGMAGYEEHKARAADMEIELNEINEVIM